MRRCLLLAGVLLYYCYMGADGLDEANSHKAYVNINAQVNAVLSEPVTPTRPGYRFAGWYYFDTMEQGEKIYLASVLSLRQGLSSYQAGHVYLDHVGDAHLLYQDQAGQLFYYSSQTGCRFSFYNDASVVTQTRKLCAAWESTADVTAAIYHLVAKDDAESAVTLAPKGGAAVSVTQLPALNLGGKEYLCLKTETQDQLYTGSTFQARGWEYLTDSASQKWLPTEAVIHLELSEATQTVDDFSKAAGTTCRMELPSEDGAYAYFAFVVYLPTEEVDYNLYAIDLAAAVSMGALNDFQDAFHRDQPPDQNAPYVLSVTTRSWHGGESTLVAEKAPDISGFVVYLNTTQSLQLQAQPGTNNLYFYYVKNGAKIGYALRYYLEQDGGYSETNMVEFSGVPAVRGEILRLDQLSQTFQLLVSQGELFRSYAGSADPEQAALYEQYRSMVVTLVQEGVSASFAVDHSVENSLNLEMVRELGRNYYLADWSPTGETLALEEGVKVDVYLDQAELLIRKVNGEGQPLAGAEFILERLVPSATGEISYRNNTYTLDAGFNGIAAVSGADGRVVFQNLSAKVGEDGMGSLYRLRETAAPAGYQRLENPLYVTVPYTVEKTVSYTVTYTVANTGISYLPSAGVFGGIYRIVLPGGGLITAAVLAAVLLPRRRKRSGSPNKH